ncbi:MAG: 16S rRNA (cytosine(1402)-N(4))-methyltransferase RsmH [Candidatus Fermentibacteria bacterium]|nr:16S rRNA (cytosine(1402)-N(4))-methyltransferase RsmH [Candidatus Fermentibacteria bacterium]
MADKPAKHKRRVRYAGTHPRKFSEKYKELNPEKYPDGVKKVMERGQTPAGMHLPVCVSEIHEALKLRRGMSGMDCTLGYGGHAEGILPRILPGGSLLGIDVDSEQLVKTEKRICKLGFDGSVFVTRHMNFSQIKDCLDVRPEGYDFILADLGVSSMQLDTPERGFSFKNSAPLDLRLDNTSGETAAELILRVKEDYLKDILTENADETHSALLAKAILTAGKKCMTTVGLASVITSALQSMGIEPDQTGLSVRRVFQALRIEVNNEFEALDQLLLSIPDCLKSGGRTAVLSFHSGEDRRVKKSFKSFTEQGVYSECVRRPVRPSFQEKHDNPRSSSAKLRWAVKA